MSKFEEFISAIGQGVEDLAKSTISDYKEQALIDADAFVSESKSDLQRWTGMLANKQLTQDDFAWLIKGRKDVAELKALKQSGLALVRVDRFKSALMDLVVDTAFDVFL